MNNWLAKAAVKAGIVKEAQIAVAAGSRVSAIWEDIERVSGLSEPELISRIAAQLRIPAATSLEADARALRMLPEKMATQYNVLPLRESHARLIVATSDPMDFSAEQALSFASGRTIDFQLAGPRAIDRAVRSSYSSDNVEALVAGFDESLTDAVVALADESNADITLQDTEAKPIVKLTNLILSDAVRERASDIHIQPVGTVGVVRFRVDGVMINVMQLPLNAVPRVISRIKVLAQMDIANRVRPQDGRARLSIRGREYDLRVSSVPISGGEKVVIRVLTPGANTKIADIGLPEHERQRIERLLRGRDGIVAVTGPTGSGKTTTLYAMLRELATGDTNIVTVEDPIEYRLAGISQMQADTKRGVTFASALRAVMRQDPDVILIGEVRDGETAGIGVQAAMTGHLVLATLHTNDAIGTVARLADLGVARSTLADTLRGALGQRLLRRLCPSCAIPVETMNEDETRLFARYSVKPAMRSRGCVECNRTGYKGRIPVVEVMVVTPQIQELVTAGASALDLQRAAVAGGMRTLLQVALEQVRNGATTLEEVERVIGDHGADDDEPAREVDPFEAPESSVPHILVVDDDPVIRQLARFVLNTGNYRITEVQNGREALDYVGRGDPVSLMILDLDMPEVGGLDVLKELRANRATASLPVVVLTGSSTSETAAMDAGADDYLGKPLEPERFLARVRAVLRRSTL